jgi:hypothetical protein
LEYFYGMYGEITADDIAENEESIHKKWELSDPIENLWTQMNAAREFAKDLNPISDLTLINASMKQLRSHGVFYDDIRDWERKLPGQQTWVNFQIHFKKASLNYNKKVTTTAAGYSGKATASKNPTSSPTKKQSGTSSKPFHLKHTFDKPMVYCYSHGLNRSHTSDKCTNKCPGHEDNATADNMMGGVRDIQPRFGEKLKVQRKPKTKETKDTKE